MPKPKVIEVLREAQAEAELWAEQHWDAVVYLACIEDEWEWIPDKVEVFDTAYWAHRDAEDEVAVFRQAADLLARNLATQLNEAADEIDPVGEVAA